MTTSAVPATMACLPVRGALVRLDIRLYSQAEVRLLTAYLQALVLSSLLGSRSADDPSLPVFEAWIAEHVTSDSISHLFEGTIAIFHSGIPGTLWNVAYEFDCDGAPLAWHIQTSIPNLGTPSLLRADRVPTRLPIVQTLIERLMGVVQATGDFEPPETPSRSMLCCRPRRIWRGWRWRQSVPMFRLHHTGRLSRRQVWPFRRVIRSDHSAARTVWPWDCRGSSIGDLVSAGLAPLAS